MARYHANSSTPEADPTSPMNQQPRSGAHILVIDDSPEIRLLATVLLEREGYVVTSAVTGEEGLAFARESITPDLILLDVMLPGMDGYEICQLLKQDETLRDVPVIFMSAQDDVQAQTEGFKAGGADYVTKPLSVPVLLARVRAHVALNAQRRSLEGMFRDALEYAPDAIILADTRWRIVQVNARTLAMFGYRREQLMGQPVEMLIPPRLREHHLQRRSVYADLGPGDLQLGVSTDCMRGDGSEFTGDLSVGLLRTNRGPLLMTVVRDVTESQRIQQEVIASRQRLRELAARGDAMREYERKNIAREVHDELGQVLTALRMDLTYADLTYGNSDSGFKDRLQGMRALVDRAIQGVRNVASHLRPSALDMGLVPALEWLSGEFQRHAGIPCTLEIETPAIDMPEHRAIGLFRIVQESLTNVSRYAQARSVRVSLRQENGQLVLRIRDDGQGFDAASRAQGRSFGLLGMQERALALEGELTVESAIGQGTTVTARVPLQTDYTPQETT
ncbi:histidine kinase [Hylemonella gracilis str. Niagara R]|uniref:Histidine kinase n=1 Tax=Hylemonella gracilis str. Niagara R TaxID=1458275 RepID=A0A016XNA7_9BURK|nr:response regulator [Hylemonella gracilis]EYC52698.1 histidine kinase [Hylemonella gracilis str. Niagara R]